VIETPRPTGRHDVVIARTVIQPDGDVLCMVRPRYRHRPDIAVEHGQAVRRWLEDAHATITRLAPLLTAGPWAIGLAGGFAVGFFAWPTADAIWRMLVGAAASLLLGFLTHLLLQLAIRWALRWAGIRLSSMAPGWAARWTTARR
jgi:hypothetical protein